MDTKELPFSSDLKDLTFVSLVAFVLTRGAMVGSEFR
jgi:hypothetical protein